MKKIFCAPQSLAAVLILSAALALTTTGTSGAANLSQSIDAGYMWDIGGTFRFRVGDLSESLPFFIDAGIGYVYQFDSGDATSARVIFINDNTGGVIEKHGQSFVFSLDMGYPFGAKKHGLVFEPYIGARYDMYTAYYAFIGNNEAFTVRSNQWGLALGSRLKLPISEKGDYFFINGGVEYYFKAPLESHGTYYYNPDGVDDRPRGTYTYEDADNAVSQPRLRPVVTLGIHYSIR